MKRMDFQETKARLETLKKDLTAKLENPNTPKEEIEKLQQSIDNYEYILELTEMNHYERGMKQ
jgi:hypothetical protein